MSLENLVVPKSKKMLNIFFKGTEIKLKDLIIARAGTT